MKFQHVTVGALDAEADLLAIGVLTDPLTDPLVRALNKALGGRVAQQVSDEDFAGKPGQTVLLSSASGIRARYLALIGAGDRESYTFARAREVAATAGRLGRRFGAETVAHIALPAPRRAGPRGLELAVEGAILGLYRFDRYRGENGRKKKNRIKTFLVSVDRRATGKGRAPTAAQRRQQSAALRRAEVVAQAVCRARDFVNEPPAVMTPTQLAAEARALAKANGLQAKILGPKDCRELGMGMFLAVGQGSDQEVRLIHLIYRPKGRPRRRVALIGKGVTFDSGGYSLKPTQAMEDMKVDMAGAATVVAAMSALKELGCRDEVHAVAACAENLVSGRAFKLGDVLRAMDGTTVEINNTDAEGRLTLGDALTYAREVVKPDEIFDFATLTGACVVALGPYTSAVMSEDEEVVSRWLAAAEAAGEDVWRLPLNPRLREQLKSHIADMRNTGERYGGAITAGLFLKHFARDTPWVHNDIAGPASLSRDSTLAPKGGTGFGVATILEYLTR